MQEAHSIHFPGIILNAVPEGSMASLGHSSLHAPQAIHSSCRIIKGIKADSSLRSE